MSEVPDVPRPAVDRPVPDAADTPAADAAAQASVSEASELQPPDVHGPADLRCSDVDRERVAEALRQAAGDGRLTLTELEDRLDSTFKARTYGDLQPITRDLPQGPYPLPGSHLTPLWKRQPDGRRQSTQTPARPGSGRVAPGAARVPAGGPVRSQDRITSILSSEKRTGRWEVPARIDVTCVLSEVVLDFTEAIVRTSEIEIHAGVVLGSLTLIVPEGVDVRMEQGGNILGERKMKPRSEVTPGSPTYHVRGFVVLGEIVVRPPASPRRSLLG